MELEQRIKKLEEDNKTTLKILQENQEIVKNLTEAVKILLATSS